MSYWRFAENSTSNAARKNTRCDSVRCGASRQETSQRTAESIRFTIDYLEVNVLDDRAIVKVWIDASFRLTPMVDQDSGDVRVPSQHTRKQDHAMFELVRDGASWRITRGL